MTYTIDPQGTWAPVYQVSLQANVIPGPSGYYNPIPGLIVPVQFNNQLAIGASAIATKPNWRLAFWANALTSIGGIGLVELGNYYVPLGASILVPPEGVSTFSLKITVPKWFRDMEIYIWQYTPT